MISFDDFYRSTHDDLIYYRVSIPGRKRRKGLCTGTRSLQHARQIVEESGAEKLLAVAQAGAFTQEVINSLTQQNNITLDSVMVPWEAWLRAHLAKTSADLFTTYVRMFSQWGDMWKKPIRQITESDIDQWLHSDARKLNTLCARLSSVRSIFKFANAKGYCPGNPTLLVRIRPQRLTVEQLEPNHVMPLTEEEYVSLLTKLQGMERDWVVLSYCCGHRLIDCAKLEYASLRPEGLLYYPKKSRTGKRLLLPFNEPLIARPELMELVQRLLAHRPVDAVYAWPEEANRYVHYIHSRRMTQLLAKCGIPNKGFHSLRRSFIVRLKNAGKTLEEIAKWVGHSSTEMTAHYAASEQNLPS